MYLQERGSAARGNRETKRADDTVPLRAKASNFSSEKTLLRSRSRSTLLFTRGLTARGQREVRDSDTDQGMKNLLWFMITIAILCYNKKNNILHYDSTLLERCSLFTHLSHLSCQNAITFYSIHVELLSKGIIYLKEFQSLIYSFGFFSFLKFTY